MVVQLGDPVRVVREPGLYWKIPFIQQVTYFDSRLLDYDASPKELLTVDKQQLVVDNYSRWRIVDPLQFYRTVRDERGAQSRLDDIVYSDLRETLGRHTLREIVSDKRERADDRRHARAAPRRRRSTASRWSTSASSAPTCPRRTSRPSSAACAPSASGRPRSSAPRATRKRARSAPSPTRTCRSSSPTRSRRAQVMRGEGDAQATRIFAEAYGRDPEFYAFQRTLDAYRTALAAAPR